MSEHNWCSKSLLITYAVIYMEVASYDLTLDSSSESSGMVMYNATKHNVCILRYSSKTEGNDLGTKGENNNKILLLFNTDV